MPGPRAPTARACLTLGSSQLEALRGLSLASGAPVAELARRAVDAYLATHVAGHAPDPPPAVPAPFEAGPARSSSHS